MAKDLSTGAHLNDNNRHSSVKNRHSALPFSPLIERAIELAAEWHDATYRKSRWRAEAFEVPGDEALRVPVMAHVTAVAMIVQRAGWDEATVAAAFLHDAIEDANRYGGTLRREVLAERLGDDVAARVMDVTEAKRDADGRPRRWQERKEGYIAHLKTAPPESAAISLADKLHNLWTINEGLQRGLDVFASEGGRQGLSAGPERQRWFHRAVLEATHHHTDGRLDGLRERLTEEITRFERLTGDERKEEWKKGGKGE